MLVNILHGMQLFIYKIPRSNIKYIRTDFLNMKHTHRIINVLLKYRLIVKLKIKKNN